MRGARERKVKSVVVEAWRRVFRGGVVEMPQRGRRETSSSRAVVWLGRRKRKRRVLGCMRIGWNLMLMDGK